LKGKGNDRVIRLRSALKKKHRKVYEAIVAIKLFKVDDNDLDGSLIEQSISVANHVSTEANLSLSPASTLTADNSKATTAGSKRPRTTLDLSSNEVNVNDDTAEWFYSDQTINKAGLQEKFNTKLLT
jgi:hypothetical protein